jgi:hypothetical protein
VNDFGCIWRFNERTIGCMQGVGLGLGLVALLTVAAFVLVSARYDATVLLRRRP